MQHDERLIKNDLIQLLLTAPGERIMRPAIGSPIPLLQFENIIDGDISTIKSGILSAIRNFEPRVTITLIDVNLNPDQSEMTITIAGAVNLNPNERFKIEIGISDGGIKLVKAE